MGKLEGECWEDHPEIAAVLEVSRTEKAGPQSSVREASLGKCLCNGRLPGPRETVQPEDTLALLAVQPAFNLPEDFPPRSPQAPLYFPTEVTCVRGVTHTLEEGKVFQLLVTVNL